MSWRPLAFSPNQTLMLVCRFRGDRALSPLLLLASAAVHGQSGPSLPEIAAESTWLQLGHYEPSLSTRSGWLSAIHPGDFFLDPDGAADPLAELQVTVRALNEPAGTDPNQHAQCRFPARLAWLKRRLGDAGAFRTDVTCPAFAAWTRSEGVSSISVVFATGFLGNPASYYGHTLLKFNFRGGDQRTN